MRVVIAEDQALLRAGLARLLRDAGFDVVAEAADASELVRKVAGHRPDIADTDVRMPPGHTDDGLRAAREIRERFPGTAVVVLSQYVMEHAAIDLVGGDAAGIGYLLKDRVADVDAFIDAVNRVANGGSALDPDVVSRMIGRRHTGALDGLTPRERDVLGLMAEGRSNRGIAETLVIAEDAVEKHVNNLLRKLDITGAPADHRRVMAVLAFLRGAPGTTPRDPLSAEMERRHGETHVCAWRNQHSGDRMTRRRSRPGRSNHTTATIRSSERFWCWRCVPHLSEPPHRLGRRQLPSHAWI